MRALLFVSLLAAGCSNYDPDLGPNPFLCGDEDEGPRCPEGYSCEINGTQEICVEGDGDGTQLTVDGNMQIDGPGGDGFDCAEDGFEPNDMTATAWETDADERDRIFGPISICPATDKDHFQIDLPAGAAKALTITVTWESGTALTGAILGGGGQVLKPLTAAGDKAIRACAPDLPGGATYFAQISGTAQNNYRVTLQTTAACSAP